MMMLMFLRGFPATCADLTRVGWITGLLPSAFSAEYFKGELTPANTLKVCETMRNIFVACLSTLGNADTCPGG